VLALERALPDVGPSLVGLRGEMGLKRGVIIDERGLVLTCAHGSKHGGRELVLLPDGDLGVARVLGIAEESDLALLAIARPERVWPALPLAGELTPGQWLYLPVPAADPESPDATAGLEVAAGQVWFIDLAAVVGRSHRYLAPALLVTGIPAWPGESGSPLLTAAGEVAGITSMAAGDAVAGLAAASLTGIRRALPDLQSGEHLTADATGPERVEAFVESLRGYAARLFAELAPVVDPTPPEERFRTALDDLERRVRARWGEASTLTREMCLEGIDELLEALERAIE
jgi:S1-C subfamily serine protease